MDVFYLIFASVEKMAVSAAFVIPIVLLARCFLGRCSKRICYLLWGIVAIRLICPVMLPSGFSLFHLVELPPSGNVMDFSEIQPGERQFSRNSDTVLLEPKGEEVSYLLEEKNAVQKEQWETTAKVEWKAWVWLAGVLGMLGYAVISCLLLKRRLMFATKRTEQVYECETVGSPFIFGLRKPVIYLPYHLSERELDYILRHEEYHIRRRDYLVKWLAYVLLAVYWFHPLVWAAYTLMNRDMEMSCDEYVLRDCTETERKEYGTLLLQFAGEKNGRRITTLAFGEKSIKQRVSHVLHYKKRTVLASGAAVLFLILLALVCLTDARNTSPEKEAQKRYGLEGETAENISQAAIDLYEAGNPYIGDAPANGRLMEVISEYFGGFGPGATTELQTSEEPYCLTLHFSGEPDERAMWRNAVFLLALIENCGEVDWDYTAGDEKTTVYVPAADVNRILEIEDIKEYGTSAAKVQELLDIMETDNEKHYQQYLEKDIENQLEAFFNVERASVALNLSNTDSYASVVLSLSGEMDAGQALEIAQYIATAIGNDNTEHIMILDSDSNVLFSGGDFAADIGANDTSEKGETIRNTLSHLPDNPALSSANIFILGGEQLSHYELWEEFQEKVSLGVPKDILLASLTTEGDAIYTCVSYDGESFYVVQDNSRDAFRGDGEIYTEHTYSDLLVEKYQREDGTVSLIAVLVNDVSLRNQDEETSLSDSMYLTSSDAWLLFSVDAEMLEKE